MKDEITLEEYNELVKAQGLVQGMKNLMLAHFWAGLTDKEVRVVCAMCGWEKEDLE